MCSLLLTPHTLSLGVIEEELDAIRVVGPIEGVTADAYARGLSKTVDSCLIDCITRIFFKKRRVSKETQCKSKRDLHRRKIDLLLLAYLPRR
jgi:hypothetical protein